MCFDSLDPGGFLDYVFQLIFLAAGCAVSYVGLALSILLIGLLPAYIYGYFFYTKKSKIGTLAGKLHVFAAATTTLLLSGILWTSAIVIGMWG